MCSQSITGWFLLRGTSSGSAGTVAAMPPSFWSRGGSKQLTCDSTCSRLATHQHLIPLSEGEMPFTHRAGLQAGSGGEGAAQSLPPPSSLRVSKAPVQASLVTHSRCTLESAWRRSLTAGQELCQAEEGSSQLHHLFSILGRAI